MTKWLLTWLLAALLALGVPPAAHAQYAEQAQFGTATGTNALALTVPSLAGVTTPPVDVPLRFLVPSPNTGAVTIALNSGSAIAVKKIGTSGLVAFGGGEYQAGMLATVIYDGTQYQAQTVAVLNAGTGSVQGVASGLVVATTGNATTAITAQSVALGNNSGGWITVGSQTGPSSVNCTITLTSTGAGGLDTGTPAASTVYNFWVISTGSATSCEASLQSVNNSTFLTHLPAGYVYYARVGADLTDSAGHLWRVIQSGRWAHVVIGTDPATVQSLFAASGTAGSISTPTWVAVTVVGAGYFAPPTADAVEVVCGESSGGAGDIMCAPNSSYGAISSITNPAPIQVYTSSSLAVMQLESTSLYWASTAGDGYMAIMGWEDNL